MKKALFQNFARLRREIDESRQTARRLRGIAVDLLRELHDRRADPGGA